MNLPIDARGRSARPGNCVVAGGEQEERFRFLAALGNITVREIIGGTKLVFSRELKPGMYSRQGQQGEDRRFPAAPWSTAP